MLPEDPRAVAAIHEAGHAIVSVVLRTGVRRVDIAPCADGREGLTKYKRHGQPYQGSRDVQERRGATTLGGMAAVWLASGRQQKHRHSPGDMWAGLTYVYEVVGTGASKATAQACWDALYGRAVAILEARWDAVEAVAAALVNEGAVDRKRLLALVAL
jgi:ATP-dependent Zn protease